MLEMIGSAWKIKEWHACEEWKAGQARTQGRSYSWIRANLKIHPETVMQYACMLTIFFHRFLLKRSPFWGFSFLDWSTSG